MKFRGDANADLNVVDSGVPHDVGVRSGGDIRPSPVLREWWHRNVCDVECARDFGVGESRAREGVSEVSGGFDVVRESGGAKVLFAKVLSKAVTRWYEFEGDGANGAFPLILYGAGRCVSRSCGATIDVVR